MSAIVHHLKLMDTTLGALKLAATQPMSNSYARVFPVHVFNHLLKQIEAFFGLTADQPMELMAHYLWSDARVDRKSVV